MAPRVQSCRTRLPSPAAALAAAALAAAFSAASFATAAVAAPAVAATVTSSTLIPGRRDHSQWRTAAVSRVRGLSD